MAKRPRVNVENNFPRHRADLEKGFRTGLMVGGQIAARAAESAPDQYNIDAIKQTIVLGVDKTKRGYTLVIAAPDFRALWYEKGTRGRKGAAKTKAAKPIPGGRGIKPQRFLKNGMKTAEPAIAEAVKRALQ